MRDFLKLLSKRVSVYEFSGKKISDVNVKKILEAGRLAPSPLNSQPWSFIVVRDFWRINQLVGSAYYGDFHTLPNLIIVLVINKDKTGGDFKGIKNGKIGYPDALLSIGMPALQMCLMATSLGISNCLLTPDESMIKSALNVNRSDFIPLMVGFGYEKIGAFRKKKERKPLSDLVFNEKWGVKLF